MDGTGRLYEAGAYEGGDETGAGWARERPLGPPPPPLIGERTADAVIVGAGVTGLSAALRLAETGGEETAGERLDEPPLVLEARTPAWGASGRSGGFVCLGGSKLSDAAFRRRYGPAALQQWRTAERAAVGYAAHLAERFEIPSCVGAGEWRLERRAGALADLTAEAAALRAAGTPAIAAGREALAAEGLAGPAFGAGIHIGVGFGVNPRAYTLGLAAAAAKAGAVLYGDSPVTAMAPAEGGRWRLATPRGAVVARRVLLALNGYADERVFPWLAGASLPVMTSILTTRPLSAEERAAQGWTSLAMAYDSRRLLHYFRLLPDGRFLFGMRGGLSAAPAALDAVRARARRHFEGYFPAWRHVETPDFHSGFACLTRRLTPYVGPAPGAPGVWTAFGYHGNGMAMGGYCGALAADQMLARTGAPSPDVLSLPLERFRPAQARRWMLRAAYLAYDALDGPMPRPGR